MSQAGDNGGDESGGDIDGEGGAGGDDGGSEGGDGGEVGDSGGEPSAAHPRSQPRRQEQQCKMGRRERTQRRARLPESRRVTIFRGKARGHVKKHIEGGARSIGAACAKV
eukprot:scaffold15675_cov48-Phaeocystis_antarctica.AAC.4